MTARMARIALVLALASLVPTAAGANGLGFKGWGPRVGISSDPDQIFGGVHFDLGEFAKGVRFQPSVDVGFGDDVVTLTGNLMVAYYFPLQAQVTPYAGGQVSVAYYDFDADCSGYGSSFFGRGHCDDSDTEIAPMAVGGIEMKLSGGSRFLAELQLGFSDLPDVKLLAGWTF
jgi:hypothetical protein